MPDRRSTDANGELTIAGLEAGTYTFTATLSGYTSASTDVVVTEDVDSTGNYCLDSDYHINNRKRGCNCCSKYTGREDCGFESEIECKNCG